MAGKKGDIKAELEEFFPGQNLSVIEMAFRGYIIVEAENYERDSDRGLAQYVSTVAARQNDIHFIKEALPRMTELVHDKTVSDQLHVALVVIMAHYFAFR